MTDAPPTAPSLILIVIGVSAGGPKALQHILPRLPHGFAAPVLVVQHYAAELFNSLLVSLSGSANLPVASAADEMVLERGHVYLCPPDHQCHVSRFKDRLISHLIPDRESTYRPSIDETMRSAAAACGSGAIGVLLTGMGADGVEGLRSIVNAAGLTVVESKETASVYGMPREALNAGVAQRVLPLHQIPTELLMELTHRGHAPHDAGDTGGAGSLPRGDRAGARPSWPGERGSGAGGAAARADGREGEERSGGRPPSTPKQGRDAGHGQIAALVQDLQSDLPIAVEAAKQQLSGLPGEAVLPQLLPLLSSEVPLVRATVVEIARRVELGASGGPLLARLCRDPDPDLRLFAVDIVKAHASDDLLDTVLVCCEDENANVALMALGALGGYAERRAVDRLAQALLAAAPQRAVALTALGRSPAPAATRHLVTARPEGHSESFLWLRALSARSDPAAVFPILDFIQRDAGELLPHALDNLASLCSSCGDALSDQALTRTRMLPFASYVSNPDPRVREPAIRLVGAVGTVDHLDALNAHFDMFDATARTLFVTTLAAFPGDRASQLLRQLAAHDDVAVAALASDLLRGL